MCTAKFEGPSIPDGGDGVGHGGWRSTERTSQNGVPGFRRNIETNCRYPRCAAPCYPRAMVSCSSKDPTACLRVLVGGGKAESLTCWFKGVRRLRGALRECGGGG